MPAFRSTDTAGVYENTKSGTFAVHFKVCGKETYFGTFKTVGEARNVCKEKRRELGLNENPKRRSRKSVKRPEPQRHNHYVCKDPTPQPDSETQCLRCTHPHLPDSVYCEHHKQRYEDGCYGETEESYIYEREIELGWRKRKPTRKSGQGS